MTNELDLQNTLEPFDQNSDLSEDEEEPVLLICGNCPQAKALAALAHKCGFIVDVVVQSSGEADNFPTAREIHALPEFENLIEACEVGRSHYVCIFAPDEASCLEALYECIESHAFYIGVWASPEERDALFAKLKEMGVPDAELAPVCCPIGLSIYAENPMQAAVAIVAELLAARAGTLGRLRLDD